MWSALAIYALTGVFGADRDPNTKLLQLAAIVPFLAATYNAGGVLFAVAYSLCSVGPRAFDAARRLTFSSERYPLLDRMRYLHSATEERRAIEAREFAYAQVRANIESPFQTCGKFWDCMFEISWLLFKLQRLVVHSHD